MIQKLLDHSGDLRIERTDGGNRGAGVGIFDDYSGSELAFCPTVKEAVLEAYDKLVCMQ